jgi:hypothetical protein
VSDEITTRLFAENAKVVLAGRRSARGVLEERVIHAEREAASLRALLNALPAELSPEADEALWCLAWGHSRK